MKKILWMGAFLEEEMMSAQLLESAVELGYRDWAPGPHDVLPGGPLYGATSRLSDSGVRLSVLDGVSTWLPVPQRRKPPVAWSVIVDIVAGLGCEAVSLLPSGPEFSTSEMIDYFGRACDSLAPLGAVAQIEFSPLGGIPDLRTAWDVVRGADRANGGIVFDTWHFFRGDGDLDVVRSVPGDRIRAVQLSDALTEPIGSLWNDTLHHRLRPGDGDFPLVDVVRILRATGAMTTGGPEIISDELGRLPLASRLRDMDDSVARLLAAAGE